MGLKPKRNLEPKMLSGVRSLAGSHEIQQHRQQELLFDFFKLSLEFGSGRFSRVTRCMTVVFPTGKLKALRVTEPCRNLPW